MGDQSERYSLWSTQRNEVLQDKCKTLLNRRGKMIDIDEIDIPGGEHIK